MTDTNHVAEILDERGAVYGDYGDLASVAQTYKQLMRSAAGWDRLSNKHKETLDLIATKVARILTGDPNHKDNWNDIAGYALLNVRKK